MKLYSICDLLKIVCLICLKIYLYGNIHTHTSFYVNRIIFHMVGPFKTASVFLTFFYLLHSCPSVILPYSPPSYLMLTTSVCPSVLFIYTQPHTSIFMHIHIYTDIHKSSDKWQDFDTGYFTSMGSYYAYLFTYLIFLLQQYFVAIPVSQLFSFFLMITCYSMM